MLGIGILSTVPFQGTNFETNFNQGLNLPAINYRLYKDNRGFDAISLAGGLHDLINDGQVTLIVAAGGLVTEEAIANSTKDYICLVGHFTANPGNNHFKGRVNLQSVLNNVRRRAHLAVPIAAGGHNIARNMHCLLSNNFSAMRGDERGPVGGIPWGNVQPTDISEGDTGPQAQVKFKNAFAAIPAGILAVVISADPYYYRFRNELVHEADIWVTAAASRRVCYPFQEHGSLISNAAKSMVCLCGPSLLQAYQFLGQLAAHVLVPVGHPAPGNLPDACNHPPAAASAT